MLRHLFLAGACCAAALHSAPGSPSRRVLILGCSVDRYAINYFCGARESPMTLREDINIPGKGDFKARSCDDPTRDTSFMYMLLPGTGYNGSLQAPFFTGFEPSTLPVVNEIAPAFAGARPDLVVVDSSLWDLANWQIVDGGGDAAHLDVAKHVQEWCARALPTLMGAVAGAFPRSRVVFRTAPATFANCSSKKAFSNGSDGHVCWHPGVDLLHECVMDSLSEGRLLGRYDVIDYYKIMADLWKTFVPKKLYRSDGYHPGSFPAIRYFNEILALLGLDSVPDPDHSWFLKDDDSGSLGNDGRFDSELEDDLP